MRTLGLPVSTDGSLGVWFFFFGPCLRAPGRGELGSVVRRWFLLAVIWALQAGRPQKSTGIPSIGECDKVIPAVSSARLWDGVISSQT